MSSSKSSALEAQALMTCLALAMLATVAAAVGQPSLGASTTTTNLTLHNLCPYPVWPLVTANAGVPSIPTNDDGDTFRRLEGHSIGLATLAFPAGPWSGRVVARTGCTSDDDDDEYNSAAAPSLCATGDAPPVTVAQMSVGGPGGAAAYSVSLVDGFNVAMAVTPHGFAAEEGHGRRCPTLGCAVDLAADCPAGARSPLPTWRVRRRRLRGRPVQGPVPRHAHQRHRRRGHPAGLRRAKRDQGRLLPRRTGHHGRPRPSLLASVSFSVGSGLDHHVSLKDVMGSLTSSLFPPVKEFDGAVSKKLELGHGTNKIRYYYGII
ncbi:hypothetical protein U9M48_000377 [Paspalum notatum var. saurae]|uniref:Pathogenesis-related protein 5 n=1 Tax=Paspalum notatum var. saurae TaxID=547442 RepID=A0AAQ3SFX4_PASNO